MPRRIDRGRSEDDRAWRRIGLLLRTGLVLVVFAASATAKAWGVVGHRIIGELAEGQLTPPARAWVAELLAGEAEPTLAGIAAWADTVRTRGTAPFHYANLPPASCSYQAARDCPGGRCLPAALGRFVLVLADPSQPRTERAQALKWVVHLVGDAHAPLHAGASEDRGGNSYQLQWDGRGTNLHALWDSGLLRSLGGSASTHAARLAGQGITAGDGVVQWIEESCRITRTDGFYPARKPGLEYLTRWQPVLDARLAQAGARLAWVLNLALVKL